MSFAGRSRSGRDDHLQLETEILDARASKSKPRFGIMRISNVMTNQRRRGRSELLRECDGATAPGAVA